MERREILLQHFDSSAYFAAATTTRVVVPAVAPDIPVAARALPVVQIGPAYRATAGAVVVHSQLLLCQPQQHDDGSIF
jgi:hypothetical protein